MIYPRGHPYNSETRQGDYSWVERGGECVFNTELWLQHPDLDALTLIYHSGLNGKCDIRSMACKREKVDRSIKEYASHGASIDNKL